MYIRNLPINSEIYKIQEEGLKTTNLEISNFHLNMLLKDFTRRQMLEWWTPTTAS